MSAKTASKIAYSGYKANSINTNLAVCRNGKPERTAFTLLGIDADSDFHNFMFQLSFKSLVGSKLSQKDKSDPRGGTQNTP
ncbi:MAG TPA: hypothetical protein VHE59_02935 [Mucilaginibacter sp.]|nr:hypothetical protein [Mucilaginibacter sp.]